MKKKKQLDVGSDLGETCCGHPYLLCLLKNFVIIYLRLMTITHHLSIYKNICSAHYL